MYTAFLVDDDSLILEEMTNFIPWMDNGFEVMGYCTDPEAAIGSFLYTLNRSRS